MLRTLTIAAVVVLVLHGLIHLLGTAVYMRVADVAEMPYKTALLGGTWDVGDGGMRLFGALWALAALGFLAASAAWLLGFGGWSTLLAGVTLFSLALTVLDYQVAFMGVIVNVAILAALALVPRLLPTGLAG
jgi:hypothetical protein